MPLVQDLLVGKIQATFMAQYNNAEQVAGEIAQAYVEYTRMALAPNGVPLLFRGTESMTLRRVIANIMRGRLYPPMASNMIGNAILAYWMQPPVTTGSGGAVTSVIPSTGVAKLQRINVNSVPQAARSLADALHMMTGTVFILNPTPLPSGVLI